MSKLKLLIALFFVTSVLLSSCGSQPTAEPVVIASLPQVSSSGWQCPKPEFPVETTSKELNLFVWAESIPREMLECFELVYGIKINREEYFSTDQLLDRLSAADSPQYDLIQPVDHAVAALIRMKKLRQLERSQLPVLQNFNSNFLDFAFDPGNKYSLPYTAGVNGIIVNTRKVSAAPQSWADLWNAEYADHLVFLNDSRAVIGLALLSLGYDINTTDPLQLAEAREKLITLLPSIKLFNSVNPSGMLLNGNVDLGVVTSGEAFLVRHEDPSYKFIFPKEGMILWQNNWAIPANALHLDAAYAWLNYINQADVFWLVLRDQPDIVPNQAALEYIRKNPASVPGTNGEGTVKLVEIFIDYLSSPANNIPPVALQNGHRIVDLGDAEELYEQIWHEIQSR